MLIACEAAAAAADLKEKEAATGLQRLRTGEPVEDSLRAELESLAARLDDEYLRLDELETSERTEVLRLFSKARATSALAYALSEDVSAPQEAIYEAIAAMDDPVNLTRMLEARLSGDV
ncbi:MAG: hypothetical protein U0359_25000 [Byssovorax sp.]